MDSEFNDVSNEILKNLKPKNTIPGLQMNFKPPPSLLKKLLNENKQKSVTPQSPDVVQSNSENLTFEEMLEKVNPKDIAKRFNLTHLNDTPETKSNKAAQEQMDTDDDLIDLTHCILSEVDRKRLLKEDIINVKNKNMNKSKIEVVPPMREMADLRIDSKLKRSKSPPRPRWPCLFEDYDYCVVEQKQQLSTYKEKLQSQKMSGISKVICYKGPNFPLPEIEFSLYPKDISHINVFKFDTPSPDEVYLANLAKMEKKKKPMFLVP